MTTFDRVRFGAFTDSRGIKRLLQLWPWAAVPFAAVYLVLLAVHFGQTIGGVYADADAASAPVIGALFGNGHAGVVLGQLGWYSTLLFELATRGLPAHRQLWEATPYVMALAAVALTSWSVWRVAGRWAAGLTAVLMICAAPRTLQLLLSLDDHAPTWFTLALLGAFLVLLEADGKRLPLALLLPLTVLIGAIAGSNAASDPLVIVAGFVPMVLAAGACLMPTRGPNSIRTAAVTVGMLAVASGAFVLTVSAMSSLHVTTANNPNTKLFGTGDQISTSFKLWWQSVATLGNGAFFGLRLSFTSGLEAACAVLSIVAVLLIPRIGWQRLRDRGPTLAAPAAARIALVVFWGTSAILLTAAFLLSAAAIDVSADRYLVGLVYAAAALVPMAAARRPTMKVTAVACSCVFGLSAVVSMARDTAAQASAVSTGLVNRVIGVAERNHLTLGYAGYWEASPVTWASNLRIRIYPVAMCAGNQLCRFYLHTVSSWYTPRPGRRSFLLTDPTFPLVQTTVPNLGPPVAVHHIGQVTMYVYPYDIATKIVH